MVLKKDHPYIMGLSFSKYDFQKNGEQITGYSISETNKNINLLYLYIYIYTEWDYQNQLSNLIGFYHLVKCHVITHAVLKHVEKIIIAILLSIHTKKLPAIAMKNK